MNLSIMQLQHLGSTEIIMIINWGTPCIRELNENELRFIEPIHKILQNIFLYKTLFNLFFILFFIFLFPLFSMFHA